MIGTRIRVRFDAEIVLYSVEATGIIDYESAAQAVQDAIGHSGARVIEATEWETGVADAPTEEKP